MKKINLLLCAASIISIGALTGYNQPTKNENNDGSINIRSVDTNNEKIGNKKGLKPSTLVTDKSFYHFTNYGYAYFGGTTPVAQVRTENEGKYNETRTIRFVSAVYLSLASTSSEDSDANMLSFLNSKDNEIGFHIMYTASNGRKVDSFYAVENAYKTITAGSKTYRASGELKSGENTMKDFTSDMGGTYHYQPADGDFYAGGQELEYKFFIAIEITDIPKEDYDTVFTVQAYQEQKGQTPTYSNSYKRANSNGDTIYALEVGDDNEIILNADSQNGDIEGSLKDVYHANAILDEDASVKITNSLGEVKQEYTATETGLHHFEYNSPLNEVGESNTLNVNSSENHASERLDIIKDKNDFANKANVRWAEPSIDNVTNEVTNTYGVSTNALKWTGVTKAGQSVYFNFRENAEYEINSNSYVELFVKNVNHTTIQSGETINGLMISLYDTEGSKIGEDVKLYKSYNTDYRVDAGNGWLKYKLPLSLFAESGTVSHLKLKAYAPMDEEEAFYIDGINIVSSTKVINPKDSETMTICSESNDLLNGKTIYWINGTYNHETEITYGTSKHSIAWTSAIAQENAMIYVNEDRSSKTITETGYLEFFIKDVGHTSSSEAKASGLWLRLYKDKDNKVDGYVDVKAYKTNNITYCTDAGNGWSYYKLPLTLFGTLGSTFDRVRLNTNVAFDEGEVMYLDGLNIVE